MELDQEKLTRNESERSRELAQRIRRELGPCSVQVLGGVGALESALEATGAVQPAEGALPELLVVVDPEAQDTIRMEDMISKSKNTPFAGRSVRGRVLKTIVGGEVRYEYGCAL